MLLQSQVLIQIILNNLKLLYLSFCEINNKPEIETNRDWREIGTNLQSQSQAFDCTIKLISCYVIQTFISFSAALLTACVIGVRDWYSNSQETLHRDTNDTLVSTVRCTHRTDETAYQWSIIFLYSYHEYASVACAVLYVPMRDIFTATNTRAK